jgi:hypothetical protein
VCAALLRTIVDCRIGGRCIDVTVTGALAKA